jgi:hypothetical protein
MWARLDDELIDHAKVFIAGAAIGKNGPAIALGFYAVGLMWSNKHLTDGFLPMDVIKSFRHVDNPTSIADALAKAGLWDRNGGSGFQIHDFSDVNPKASKVKAKRRRDRERKQRERDAKEAEDDARL